MPLYQDQPKNNNSGRTFEGIFTFEFIQVEELVKLKDARMGNSINVPHFPHEVDYYWLKGELQIDGSAYSQKFSVFARPEQFDENTGEIIKGDTLFRLENIYKSFGIETVYDEEHQFYYYPAELLVSKRGQCILYRKPFDNNKGYITNVYSLLVSETYSEDKLMERFLNEIANGFVTVHESSQFYPDRKVTIPAITPAQTKTTAVQSVPSF
jgi:hypothetical protein